MVRLGSTPATGSWRGIFFDFFIFIFFNCGVNCFIGDPLPHPQANYSLLGFYRVFFLCLMKVKDVDRVNYGINKVFLSFVGLTQEMIDLLSFYRVFL